MASIFWGANRPDAPRAVWSGLRDACRRLDCLTGRKLGQPAGLAAAPPATQRAPPFVSPATTLRRDGVGRQAGLNERIPSLRPTSTPS